jgi:hypothetical protein
LGYLTCFESKRAGFVSFYTRLLGVPDVFCFKIARNGEKGSRSSKEAACFFMEGSKTSSEAIKKTFERLQDGCGRSLLLYIRSGKGSEMKEVLKKMVTIFCK